MSGFLESWADPQMRHAMIVHFPVVLSILGVALTAAAAIWFRGDRGTLLRGLTVALLALLTISSFAARQSGPGAEQSVEGALDEAGERELQHHKEDGMNLFLFPALATLLAGASFVPRTPVRVTCAWLAFVATGITALRVAYVADHGGRLVYVHGAVGGLAGAAGESGGAEPLDDPRLVHFREQVRPILLQHCLRCHRPDRVKRSGGLDQTTIAGILAGGYSGPAIVPGQPDESLLIKAVRWEIEDLEMPAGKDKLSDEDIATLEQWIAQGAVWEDFELVGDDGKRMRDEG